MAQSPVMEKSPRPKARPDGVGATAGKTEKLGMLEKFANNPQLAAFMLNTAIGLLSQEGFGRALAGGAKGMGDFMSAEMARLKAEEEKRAALAAKGGSGGRGGSGGSGASGGSGVILTAGGVKINDKEFDKIFEKNMEYLEDSDLSYEERMATATTMTYRYFGETMPYEELTGAKQRLDAAIASGDQAAIDAAQWEYNELQKTFGSRYTAKPALEQFYVAQAEADNERLLAEESSPPDMNGVTQPPLPGMGATDPVAPAVVTPGTDPLGNWGTGPSPMLPAGDLSLAGIPAAPSGLDPTAMWATPQGGLPAEQSGMPSKKPWWMP